MSFIFKPFDDMTPEDYQAVGLKAGLEIHQQLLTKRKLFCRCPAGCYSDKYDAEILRHMRPTLSELGEYDGTALMEFKTKKEIIYRIQSNTVCTYEMDDTPPFMIDEEALDIALEVAVLLKLNLVNELHIARKQYLDGSIPTGFQRTTIFGVDGWIPYRNRKIRIAQLGLEEDACREVSDVGHERVYLTDRLGMPLIEPVTYPDMRTPQETAEVAELLRRLTRSTGKVRTGYGAGRQDVNVSVTGGTRIEIKGVPRIPKIPLLVYNEAMRQCNLLRIRGLLKEKGVTQDSFNATIHDVTRALAKTKYIPVIRALERNEIVKCVKLGGFAGVFNEKTQTDTTFAKEFSDRVRVISCLTRLPNIVHSDTASEALSATDWKLIRQRVKTGQNDGLILVWGNGEDVECACKEIIIRAKDALEGVPNETRQALKDGTTGFERILPGADRMYPDTDLPPIAVTKERMDRIRAHLPEPPWDREERYAPLGLSQDIMDRLLVSKRAQLFNKLYQEMDLNPKLIGEVLFRISIALSRKGLDPDQLTDEDLLTLFKAYQEKAFTREAFPKLLSRLLEAPAVNGFENHLAQTLERLHIKPVNEFGVKARVKEEVKKADFNKFPTMDQMHRSLMGNMMKDLLGCADGELMACYLTEELKK